MRERDINHKDRQNFDAVQHITSDSVMTLFVSNSLWQRYKSILESDQECLDSFLDKSLDPLSRLGRAWSSLCVTGVGGCSKIPAICTHLEVILLL